VYRLGSNPLSSRACLTRKGYSPSFVIVLRTDSKSPRSICCKVRLTMLLLLIFCRALGSGSQWEQLGSAFPRKYTRDTVESQLGQYIDHNFLSPLPVHTSQIGIQLVTFRIRTYNVLTFKSTRQSIAIPPSKKADACLIGSQLRLRIALMGNTNNCSWNTAFSTVPKYVRGDKTLHSVKGWCSCITLRKGQPRTVLSFTGF
jgi:hypothetical protein